MNKQEAIQEMYKGNYEGLHRRIKMNRDNFIYISDIFLNIKQRNEKNHAINMFREVSISNDTISVKFYRNEKN